ncbi:MULTISPECIES: hypothetical protein [Mesorhizobium]|uniref:Uncharacterized protein n=1 Tax=Rhizobium loti TaxID=381 RepID=A0A6M7U2K2_RHILI|nr:MULTISPECIES: hypothetical protein [Mesorhizobium]OBQ62082.1 hypothetical protein A8145_20615 [Mesorhizobium loti]QKC71142.1 hypothetical protein EB815_19865 [Mesorhizobium loti]QKC90127.1 hypothetical protein EB230_18230 [Mesorhizobium sp. NZP2234]
MKSDSHACADQKQGLTLVRRSVAVDANAMARRDPSRYGIASIMLDASGPLFLVLAPDVKASRQAI